MADNNSEFSVPIDRARFRYQGFYPKRVYSADVPKAPYECARCGAPGAAEHEFLLPETWRLRRLPLIVLSSLLIITLGGLYLLSGHIAEPIQTVVFFAAMIAYLLVLSAVAPKFVKIPYFLCENCSSRFLGLRRRVYWATACMAVCLAAVSGTMLCTILGVEIAPLYTWLAIAGGAASYVALAISSTKARSFPKISIKWNPDESGVVIAFCGEFKERGRNR